MTLVPGITVVTPSIPGRNDYLREAVQSVSNQTLRPVAHIIVHDSTGDGAAITRTKGLFMVQTEWTAFLDDDDELREIHLEHLMRKAEEDQADLVFPWFDVTGGMGGKDPFPKNEKREWTLDDPHHTTITFLVRTEVARVVGGFLDGLPPELWPGQVGQKEGEEFRFVVRVAQAGYKISKLHERTWLWRHHGRNTSGLPENVKTTPLPATPPDVAPAERPRRGPIVGHAY